MAQTVFGATMVDLQYLLRTTTTLISLSQTASGVGFLVGSLSGFLYKYINRQLTIVVMVSMMAIFGGLYPWCPSIWWLYGASAVGGVGAGAWDSASSIWMVEMWAHNSGPLLQILQCMYGLGSIVGPLIVGQYVLGDMACEGTDGDTTTTQALGDTTTALILITTTDINYSVDRGSRLKPPFAIIAVLGVIAPIALLILFIVKRYRAPQPANTTSDIGSVHSDDPVVVVELRGSKSDRIILIIIMSLTFITYSGFELMHFTYSSTYYQYKHILSAKTATTVLSLMAATFTAGRLVAAVVAINEAGVQY
ncbi:unnamed protein product [Medioppia subpectinata]|uniref:Sodium-dependent glucose transporter 1 n=1 Tax=Medioppia subpectinata TaxID=1979941 RepID=A0A7R9Q0Z4_9ACAR|nr:unnamed protein product [Medioppia subpectinata]CAG2108049.1 unnamed protein product [Medioppia subpectinata]